MILLIATIYYQHPTPTPWHLWLKHILVIDILNISLETPLQSMLIVNK